MLSLIVWASIEIQRQLHEYRSRPVVTDPTIISHGPPPGEQCEWPWLQIEAERRHPTPHY